MGSTGFDQLAAAGVENAQRQAMQKQSYDMLQRQFLASQYDNVINQPLPDQSKDPEGYQKALDAKAKALESRQKVYSPDHHANLFDSIHGLITGQQQGAQPQTPPTPNGAPTTAPGSTPGHPFQPVADPNHPLNKGQQLLDTLKQHLHAAAHPIAPQPGPDWKSLAAAPGPQDVALAAEKRKNEFQLSLEAAKEKDRQDDINSRKKPQLKAYTLPDGSQQWLDAGDPTKIPEGAKPVLTVGGKPKDSQAALATYIRAKYGENPTWQEIAEGTAEHQRLMAGVTVGSHQALEFDGDGVPHVVTLESTSRKEFTPPVSSSAPSVPDSMAGPNARLNAKKPQSKQIPNQLNFRKATPAGTKANELVDTAQNSYLDVQKAGGSDGKSLDPVGSQGVVLAWLRGRVNRVTQSEINSVRNLGGIFQKFDGSVSSLVKGTMSPQQYKWFLDSARRNYENAQEVAKKYKSPQSSASPSVPDSSQKVKVYNPATGRVE